MTDLKARVILTAVDNVSGVMSKMSKKIDKAGKVMAANGTALRSAGMKMTAAFTLPAVGAVRSAADFEQAMLEWKKPPTRWGRPRVLLRRGPPLIVCQVFFPSRIATSLRWRPKHRRRVLHLRM